MARPKLAAVTTNPEPLSNGFELTESEKRALLVQGLAEIEKHIEEKDRVVALIRTSRKKLVANGFKPKVIDFALRLRKDEDDVIIEQRRAEIEVARFLNHPVGTQPELPLDAAPSADAFAAGENAGASGETCKSPYGPGTADDQDWIKGWHQGQANITSAFKKLEAKAAAEAEAEVDEAGDEDEDVV